MAIDNAAAYREREEWLANVTSDARLKTRASLAVAVRLAQHKNLKTGQCNPSIETIAKGAATKPRNVKYGLAALEKTGWVKRHTEPGATTQYELITPRGATRCTPPASEGVQESVEGVQPTEGVGATAGQKGCNGLHPNLENIEMNTEGTVCVDTHALPIEILGGRQGQPSDAEVESSWEEFWQQYPKKMHKDAAFKKYREIVQSGRATIDELSDGARKYALAREVACRHAPGQRRYDLYPKRWLDDGCWKDDPVAHAEGDGSARKSFDAEVKVKACKEARAKEELQRQQQAASKKQRQEDEHRNFEANQKEWTETILPLLRAELGDDICKRYFSNVVNEGVCRTADGSTLFLWTRGAFDAEKIQREFSSAIKRCLSVMDVRVRAGGEYKRAS